MKRVFAYVNKFHVRFCLEWLQCFEFELLVESLCYSAAFEIDDVLSCSVFDVPIILFVCPCVFEVAIKFFNELLRGVVYLDEHSKQKS